MVFFAQSTGELERLADILQEYRFPFSWASSRPIPRARIWRSAPIMAGAVASTFLVKGAVRRGVILPEAQLAIIRLRGSVRHLRTGRAARSQQIAARGLPGRHGGPEAGRFRGARDARRRQISGHARDRARRQQGRLHAARIRRRRQALRSAHAHGSGPEVPRRGRGRGAAARPHGRSHLDTHQVAASKPRCATWRTSC